MSHHARIAAVLTALLLLTGAGAAEPPGLLHVYKNPWCGCCTDWAARMEEAGYRVQLTELADLAPLRQKAGVPEHLEGCHTAVIDGYVVEGHVPAAALGKLLAEQPEIRGISVPGMPVGSPGMGDDPHARYDVLTIEGDGASPSVFFEAGR